MWIKRICAACAAAALAIVVPAVSGPVAHAAPAPTLEPPNLQTIVPTNSFSVVDDNGVREFRYTHLIYDAGPGPLEIQPSYDSASGQYHGTQLIYAKDSSGNWTLAQSVRVPDIFVYHAEHGHFHFPMASFGLYAVAPDGSPGAVVAMSPKVGFCIDDSYIYDSTIPNSGTFIGSRSSCTDPTGLRGISVGGADEYDYRDPGQAIPIDGVPDGTYWFRAITDPNNDFIESDETDNETDVQVTISNGNVSVGAVVHPNTTPPTGALAAPADGAIARGQVTVTATSSSPSISKVDLLVDGQVLGTSASTASPFTLTWDSTTAVDGQHWMAARFTDASGRVGTSPVNVVTVSNIGGGPSPGSGLALDGQSSVDGRGALTAAAIPVQSGDVLVCYASSDGPSGAPQTLTVSGSGLTWTLVTRANGMPGTSEIWKAAVPDGVTTAAAAVTPAHSGYDGSATLVSYSGSAGVGAVATTSVSSGAAGVTVTTTGAGSWVWGVGNDWDKAVARTFDAGQSMTHQWVDSGSGDTFWVQAQASPTPAAGTGVPINDTAPTGDRVNLAAAEILAGSYTPPAPDTTPPVVTLTDPADGSTVSGSVALGATAADNVGVAGVTFYADGAPIGSPVSAPPFMTHWDSTAVAAGTHVLTAQAKDAAGNVGTSAPVTVTVDNSAPPPAVIAIDAKVLKQGKGTLVSPGLTTTGANDLVVAFVTQDGPNAASAQTSTVTGGGLTWTLQKRSNTQAGTSEVWTAVATAPVAGAAITATPGKTGYDGLLTVIAFANAKGPGIAGASGAPSGAPTIYLPGIAAGSWVFAAGNDWDRAVARTPASGQTVQQQWVDSGTGDTFWVQSTAAANTALGLVTIADTAPTNDRYNYVALEIVPNAGS